jgi:hypothetical protein
MIAGAFAWVASIYLSHVPLSSPIDGRVADREVAGAVAATYSVDIATS